jgi:hypothetical protein
MQTDRFFWYKGLSLVQRRTLWCPTWLGWFCLALFLAAPIFWWCYSGELFLSSTDRRPAEVLVVEGWIGREGIQAAAAEFVQHGYTYVVASGGLTSSERWEEGGWNYAVGAAHELMRSGVPESRIIVATARDVERERTFESTIAVSRALKSEHIQPSAINVFTYGPHARRSRLVFTKVFQPETKVGVISWAPVTYRSEPWWRSSDRAKDFLTETAGYFYEAFFNSGRKSNTSDQETLPVSP